MSRKPRHSAKNARPTAAPVQPADDFGLGWIRERVGSGLARTAVVLACAGLHTRLEQHQAETEDARFRVIVERYGGAALFVSRRGPIATWRTSRFSEHDVRLAGMAALALVAECGASSPMLRCGIAAGAIFVPDAAPTSGPEEQPLGLAGLMAVAADRARHAPAATIAIDAEALRMSSNAFEAAPLEPLEGTGPAGAPPLLRLVGRRPEFIERPLTTAPRLIGRDRELGSIIAAWDAVAKGQPQRAMLVVGDAGSGKSALVRTARRKAAAAGGLTVWVSCMPQTRAEVATPIGDLLRRLWFRAGEHVNNGCEVEPPQDPGSARDALDMVLALARRRPPMLIVEDVHWADPPTIEFLTVLAEELAQDTPGDILLVMTSRGALPAPIQARAEIVSLPTLTTDQMLAIVADADVGGHTEEQRLQIVACAGGNPLLALELARARSGLDGALEPAGPSAAATDRPAVLAEVLGHRLAMLRALKPLAQAAAVFADQIQAAVLAEMLAVDARWLEQQLAELEAQGIVCEHRGGRGRWFRFTHILLREAAAASIEPQRRRELHRLAAEALARRADFDRLVDPGVVADHFMQSGLEMEALQWWRRAARKAAGAASTRAELAHLRQALAISAKPSSTLRHLSHLDILRQLGVVLIQLRGSAGPEVRATFESALALADSIDGGAGAVRFDLLWGLDAFLLARGEVCEALPVGEELLATARQLANDQLLMLANRMHGVGLLLSGALGGAIAAYRDALSRYDERRDAALRFDWASDQGVVAHAHLCWALSIAGDDDGALQHARLALKLANRLRHAHSSAHALGVLATAAQIRGDRGGAGAFAVAARALGVHHDLPYWVAWADIVLARVTATAIPEHGSASIRQAIAAYRATGAGQALPYALMLLAESELEGGQPRRAIQAVAAARETAARGIRIWDCELDRLEAVALRRLNATGGRVEELLTRGHALAVEQGALSFARRCLAEREGLGHERDARSGLAAAWP